MIKENNNFNNQTEEDIIREVAEEEGLSYEEVKEIWDTFKKTLRNKRNSAKSKNDRTKLKAKRKQAKKSRRRNRK